MATRQTAIATALFLLPQIALAAPDPAVIEAMEDARFQAQVASDVPALEAAIAKDATYIHANGLVQDRKAYLDSVMAGKSRYRAIEVKAREVLPLGDDSVVTHSDVTLHVGTDKTIETRATGVYTLRDGKWLLVSWQSTPIAASSSPQAAP